MQQRGFQEYKTKHVTRGFCNERLLVLLRAAELLEDSISGYV